MSHQLSTFINAFNGGTRPNRFKITISNSQASGSSSSAVTITNSTTHAMAASLPESNVGVIPIPFRGRIYKFPGDRDYNLWNVTMLDDTNGIFAQWHSWSNEFNSHSGNIMKARPARGLFKHIDVDLLDHGDATAKPLRTFTLRNAWPVSVGAVELNMGKLNEPGQFACTLAFHELKIVTAAADGGGQTIN